MNLKEIVNKIKAGDVSDLFSRKHHGKTIHPAEVARIFAAVPPKNALRIFLSLPADDQVRVFPYLENKAQKTILGSLPGESAGYVLNQLSSDDRTLFLSTLNGVDLTYALSLLEERKKDNSHDMLGYPENSVARILNTDFATIHGEHTIAEAAAHLRKHHKDNETANVIYVVDKDGRLVDDIPIRRMVLNEPGKKVSEIMDGFITKLNIRDTKDEAVAKFKEYDRVALPVTNDDNVLLGVVTVDDVLDVAEAKDTAEIQKFGGVEELDYPYVKTPILSLLRKRAGWLIILFLGEMFTATAMGYFDNEISKAVVLALFIPLIISSGGNSGSQAATLIIRAMALKEITFRQWWYVMRREVLSGLVLGIILGSIGVIRITVWQQMNWYDYGQHWFLLAITIFFSLIGIVLWGTLIGAMIPMMLKRLKIDPATSSAPFVATLVDVTGLVIYFSIAAVILKGTLLP
jgi:magnesium transporter